MNMASLRRSLQGLSIPENPERVSPVPKTPLLERRTSKKGKLQKMTIPESNTGRKSPPKSPTVERRMSKSNPIVIVRDNNLTEEQMNEIIASFELIDLNSDGRISKGELVKAAALIGMNPTEEDAKAMMRLADLDGDGFIDFAEYKNMMKHNYIEIDIEKERLLAAFRVLDKNKDGFLSRDELRAALTFQNPPNDEFDVELFLDEADTNRDGKIDYNEFVKSKLCKKIFG